MHALIATDGSDVSIEAARKGIALLNPTKVTLLTVADTSVAEDSGAGGFEGNLLSPAEAEQARTALLGAGDAELDDTIAAIGVDPAIVDRKLVEGASGQMIVHVAGELDVDVIVIGSHGKGWLKRVVIGSISEYVVHHSDIPVLVVRNEPDHSKS
ncbi:MAG TPA: universal stress protein [Microthrixaceae bacterium]|nr:universal stress protein [Microthrixaceae bacterium]